MSRNSALRLSCLLALPGLLGGCGAADTDPGPGGVSVGEARALDEAAQMLDSRRLPDEALDEASPESGQPAPEATP